MHLAYFTDEDFPQLRGYYEEPFWVEQDSDDFLVTLDRLESDERAGKPRPEWANRLFLPYPEALDQMRHAVSEKHIEAADYLERIGG